MIRVLTPVILVTLYVAFAALGCGGSTPAVQPPDSAVKEPLLQPEPHAQIVLFTMARCPHCADLMKTLLPIRRELGQSVSIAIAFIGGPGSSLGDAEVEAAEMELCVGMHAEPEQWFGFLECIYDGSKWKRLPRGWTGCASENGIDVGAVTTCIDDSVGEEQLVRSVAISASKGIRAAPTMFIDGRPYAGDRSRGDILSRVCYLAGSEETRPEACDGVEPVPQIPATLLEDDRCDDPDLCDISREIEFLQDLLPTMKLTRLDFSTPEGLKLYQLIRKGEGPAHLPLLVLDSSLSHFQGEMESMEEFLVEFGDGYVMPLGRGWDPLAEICDNEIDDNGDGKADCADDDCVGKLLCREEVQGKLDLFIMSRCPFGIELVPSVEAVIQHVGRDRSRLDLRFQFIGDVLEDGTLDSMHGDLELEEDLRMMCAQDLYGERYKFMEYVTCRADTYTSRDWQKCVPAGMSSRKIQKCAEGERGQKLLRESFELSNATGLMGSPSWLLNNKIEMEGRTAGTILKAYCERNDLPECSKEIKDVESEDGPSADRCE